MKGEGKKTKRQLELCGVFTHGRLHLFGGFIKKNNHLRLKWITDGSLLFTWLISLESHPGTHFRRLVQQTLDLTCGSLSGKELVPGATKINQAPKTKIKKQIVRAPWKPKAPQRWCLFFFSIFNVKVRVGKGDLRFGSI